MNLFFDRVLVINLHDKTERWRKVNAQLKRLGIKATRFVAVDGRAPTNAAANVKLREFKKKYGLTFEKRVRGSPITARETSAAASLTIGTVLILRDMVERGLDRVLILEDDVNFDKNFDALFAQRVKSLSTLKPWDLFYLGCGDKCGSVGIGGAKRAAHPHESPYGPLGWLDNPLYTVHPDDLRLACPPSKCKRLKPGISAAFHAGGTWAYAYSLRGAKKLLAYVDSFAKRGKPMPTPHIDQLVHLAIEAYKRQGAPMVVYASDPPIVWHEGGAYRADSDIPWEY